MPPRHDPLADLVGRINRDPEDRTLSDRRVGVLGVGQIGGGMVRTLRRAGWDVVIAPRHPEQAQDLVEAGAILREHPRHLTPEVDQVITSLPDAAAVRDVLWGSQGLLTGGAWSGLLIETSTIKPEEARALAAELGAIGVGMLDAPVSGGAAGADAGTLSIMVGGPEELLRSAQPVLSVVGSRTVHCGGHGAGQVTKACNQLIVMSTLVAVAEALTLAEHAGVDPVAVRAALLGGFASSPILEGQGERMLQGRFEAGGRARFHAKDIDAIRRMAAAADLSLPMFDAVRSQFEALLAEPGGGDLDHAAVYRRYPHPGRHTAQPD